MYRQAVVSIQWVVWVFSPRLKRPGRDSGHGAEVRNEWNYTYTCLYALKACEETTVYQYTFPVFEIKETLCHRSILTCSSDVLSWAVIVITYNNPVFVFIYNRFE
jgi:hypothetical protein